MKVFTALVVYVMIGGFIAELGQQDVYEDCGKNLSDETIKYTTFGWPVMIAIGAIGPDLKFSVCEGDE